MGKDKQTFKKFSKAKNFGLSDSSKVHLFFERSGTFKKAFEKYGFVATDYDMEAEHNKENNPVEKTHGFSRSRISSRFAENFIESVILD